MVGKINKKKQIISRFDRSSSAITIDVSDFVGIYSALPIWNEFLKELGQSHHSKEEQLQIIASNRKKFRSFLLDYTQEEINRLFLMKNLLIFYLNPIFFPFHTSFEWILSCMSEMKSTGCVNVVSSIREVCSTFWNFLFKEIQSQHDQNTASSLQKWMVTLSSMILLDRDFSWLSVNVNDSMNIKVVLCMHQKLLSSLLDPASSSSEKEKAEKREESNASSLATSNDGPVRLAKESIQLLSLYIELIRNIYILVKAHWNDLSAFSVDEEWMLSLKESFSLCLYLLTASGNSNSNNGSDTTNSNFNLNDNHQLSSKDLMNSCGSTLSILCFYFWKMDQSSVTTVTTSPFLLFLSSLTSLDQFSVVSFGSFVSNIPLTKGSSAFSHLSLIARAALTRGIITLADTQNTFFSTCQLLNESLMEFLFVCSSKGESFDQLFCLQSVEVWLNQVSLLFVKEFVTVEVIETSENYLIMTLKIMKLIKASWNHPNRQVKKISSFLFLVFS
jgi:hypothetical protein